MKKLKLALTGAMALAMMMPMVATSVSAAEISSDPDSSDYNSNTDVVFDDQNIIPDPNNPTDPEWGVKIPTTVKLNKDTMAYGEGKDISVEIVSIANEKITDAEVKVEVKSANTFKLKDKAATNKAKDLKYVASYAVGADQEGIKLTNSNPKDNATKNGTLIATFRDSQKNAEGDADAQAKNKVVGKAYLESTPTKTGDYSDTLTYVVTTETATR